ncbi:hypothetical protein DOTSEDRAFT_68599 [Dothistroma septosporum NZE10]|uniref:Uncharacterized protein n=1 Tax=Dothistroma septosporum (strain NZE10 / CBS 128990) TaxID=675120 RepID=N1Q4Z5_DOTSN|nr:hypothetical protein DOTSEDRAFT_68599 [Dothistroma septosporum NZE10]
MGLASFFAAWRGDKAKVATPQSPPLRRSNDHHLASSTSRHQRLGSYEAPRHPVTALPSPPPNAASATVAASNEERSKGRAATPSQSKPKSRRRSIFGGRHDDDEYVPAMPGRAYSRHNKARDGIEMMPPGSAASNDSQTSATTSKPRRLSLGYALGSRSKDDSKRKSWFSSNRQTITAADMPPLPPMPVIIPDTRGSARAALPLDKRRSRAASIKSTTSTVRGPKRRSFWASSNPDDSDEEIPPVPSLTPDSMTSDPFDNVDYTRSVDLTQTTTRTYDTKPGRPLSVSTVRTVRSYKPKSAAKGFLKSTSGATETARLSYRKSFNVEDDAAMVCLTEEQRIEWAKLMNEGDTFQDHSLRTMKSHTSDCSGKDKFSNDQALAALEFGVR